MCKPSATTTITTSTGVELFNYSEAKFYTYNLYSQIKFYKCNLYSQAEFVKYSPYNNNVLFYYYTKVESSHFYLAKF